MMVWPNVFGVARGCTCSWDQVLQWNSYLAEWVGIIMNSWAEEMECESSDVCSTFDLPHLVKFFQSYRVDIFWLWLPPGNVFD